MKELYAKLREERLVMATQKGFTGLDGKIGTILKAFGEPLVAHEGGSTEGFAFMQTPLYDPYEELDEDEIPEYDENSPTLIGFWFDGLRRGIHMEIKYMKDTNDLSLTYKGYQVYAEEGGELICYVPHKEWEEKIEQLFVQARKKQVLDMRAIAEEEQKEQMKEKLSLLEKIKRLWGTA